MNNKLMKLIHKISKIILVILIIFLLFSIAFGTIHLIFVFVLRLISPEPYYFAIEVHELFDVFGMVLILVIGYELIKSISIILESDKVPFLPILQIAIIAIANKIITLDIKHTEFQTLIGIAAITVSLGVAYYFFYNKERVVKDTKKDRQDL